MPFSGLWFQFSHNLELQQLITREFLADLQDSGVKINLKSQETGYFTNELYREKTTMAGCASDLP